jgi:hypothetical protein
MSRSTSIVKNASRRRRRCCCGYGQTTTGGGEGGGVIRAAAAGIGRVADARGGAARVLHYVPRTVQPVADREDLVDVVQGQTEIGRKVRRTAEEDRIHDISL